MVSVDTIARGLEVPWGVARAPDGRVFLTERVGRIRVIEDGSLVSTPWASLDVFAQYGSLGPESGLLGIALAPDFASSAEVYVLASTWRTPGDRDHRLATRLWRHLAGFVSPQARLRIRNQVVRFTERDGRGTEATVIVDDLPTSHYHAGGALSFGPDGKLYVSVGDATMPALSADREVPIGKILRFDRDGAIPSDNPDPSSSVWITGLRNSQAVVWLPDGTLFGVDHGPSGMPQEGGRTGDDELNVLVAGRDYGWPRATGWNALEGVESPVWVWKAGFAPAGLAVTQPDDVPGAATMLVAGLGSRRIERLQLSRDSDGRWRAIARDTLLGHGWGRLRTVIALADGTFLVTTSNRDARGVPGPDDDLVLRVRVATK